MRLYWPTLDMLVENPGATLCDATCPSPRWFESLGPPPPGDVRLDTGTLQGEGFRGRGAVLQQGLGELELALFVFDGGRISGEWIVRGPRPAAILLRGEGRIEAHIDARDAGARREGPGLAASPGGGGGFAGSGGAPGGGGRGGPSYGLASRFEVGSGGQHGEATGGRGGGGLQLGALGDLELCGARIDVSGRDGEATDRGVAGGGGSGGTVVLHGAEVRLDPETWIDVAGGAGGDGEGAGLGGGGGGGGYVVGVADRPGAVDPKGAEFVAEGGPGGRQGDAGAGGHGLVYLAGLRPRGARGRAHPTRRSRSAAAHRQA